MTVLYANNAATTLAAGITDSATTLSLAAGAGALFPSPGAGQVFYGTLENAAGTVLEIFKCTARSVDALTVVRGQDGTAAQAFSTGDAVEIRMTRALLNEFAQLAGNNTWTGTNDYAAITVTSIEIATAMGVASGGTGRATLTSGAVLIGAGTSAVGFVAPGASGNVLMSNGTAWASAAAGIPVLPVIVANGGTGLETLPSKALLVGNGTGTVASIAPGTNGQALVSNGTDWAAATLSQAGRLLGIQTFTASGTYTPTAGTTYAEVTVVGGGGANYFTDYFIPGGNGGLALGRVAIAGAVAVTVGAGGAGGGGAGGASSFSSVSASGGGSVDGVGSGGAVNGVGPLYGFGKNGDSVMAYENGVAGVVIVREYS